MAASPSASRKPHDPEVLEGEYVVVRQSRPMVH
jgi:hypothetical protein